MTKLLPGSLTEDSAVIDYRGNCQSVGPCFIPSNIKPQRKELLGEAGWAVCPAADWPSILPDQGLACIVHLSYYGDNP